MSLVRSIMMVLVMSMAMLLTSCRIFVTTIISVSDLKNPEVRTVPVMLSSDSPGCGKEFLDRIASQFKSFHEINPLGCFNEGGKDLRSYWQMSIPLLRKGDEGKIPYLSGSVYYSQNNSIIAIFNPSFYDKLKQYTVGQGVDMGTDVVVSFQIKNDTATPIRLAAQGVYVDNNAVGTEMNVFEIRPGGKVWVKLSNVGVNSLMLEGIEPVGVIPARTSE